MPNSERPLSPHLQIWKWTLTMFLSILHRATGSALSVGMVVVVVWLISAASGPASYEIFMNLITSPLGLFCLVGWSLAVYLHLCTGIRHLLMDMGLLFKIEDADKAGVLILIVAVVLTALSWAFIGLKL
jgi:succinate dehydrogenase / fumarate reductase, cytochrome b subunit